MHNKDFRSENPNRRKLVEEGDVDYDERDSNYNERDVDYDVRDSQESVRDSDYYERNTDDNEAAPGFHEANSGFRKANTGFHESVPDENVPKKHSHGGAAPEAWENERTRKECTRQERIENEQQEKEQQENAQQGRGAARAAERQQHARRAAWRQRAVIVLLASVLAVFVIALVMILSGRGAGRGQEEYAGDTSDAGALADSTAAQAPTDSEEEKPGRTLADMSVGDEHDALLQYASTNFSGDQYYVIQDADDYALLILADQLFEGEIGASQVTCYAVAQDGSVQTCGQVMTDGSTTLVETDGESLASYISHGDMQYREYRLNTTTRELEITLENKGEAASQSHVAAITQKGLHVLDFGNHAWSAVYRALLTQLQEEHGKSQIVYDPFMTWGDDDLPQEDDVCYQGLCFANLTDLDGDHAPELIIAYAEESSEEKTGSASGSETANKAGTTQAAFHYITEIYQADTNHGDDNTSADEGASGNSSQNADELSGARLLWHGASGGNGSTVPCQAAIGLDNDGRVFYLQYADDGEGYYAITIDADGTVSGEDHYRKLSDSAIRYSSQYPLQRTAEVSEKDFASTASGMQYAIYMTGLSYEEVEGPETDDADTLYTALIRHLEYQYGQPGIEEYDDIISKGVRGQFYAGLCFLELLDFDGDGTKELLAATVDAGTDSDADAGTDTNTSSGTRDTNSETTSGTDASINADTNSGVNAGSGSANSVSNSSDASASFWRPSKVKLFTIKDGKLSLAWSGQPFMNGHYTERYFFLKSYQGKEYLMIPTAMGAKNFRAITVENGKGVVYGWDSELASAEGITDDMTCYALNGYILTQEENTDDGTSGLTDSYPARFTSVRSVTQKVLQQYQLQDSNDYRIVRKELPESMRVSEEEEEEDQTQEELSVSPQEQNLRNILTQRSGMKIIACYFNDYDGDGKYEAFAEMGNTSAGTGNSAAAEGSAGSNTGSTDSAGGSEGPTASQFWFASNDGSVCQAVNASTSWWGKDHIASPHVLDFGTRKFITLSDYGGGSGALTRIYGVQRRSWFAVEEPSGMWINQAGKGTRNFEIVGDAFDAVKETVNNSTTGHTYKTYYFYYDSTDNSFHEYGARAMSGEEFQHYNGAEAVLEGITRQHAAAVVNSILYRTNGLIHVNYSVTSADGSTVEYYNQTLSVQDNTVTPTGGEEQGTYQAALFPDLADAS